MKKVKMILLLLTLIFLSISINYGATLATVVSATASTVSGGNTAAMSCDKNIATRWESAQADPQWIYWDLGSSQALSQIIIEWESASGGNYTIQGSTDAATWTVLATVANTVGMVDHLKITNNISGTFRYVKMNGTTRTTGYAYSIWEVYIYTGTPASSIPAVSSSSTATVSSSGTATLATIAAATASAVVGGNTAAMSFDKNAGTRWETPAADPQWIYWDLGSAKVLNSIMIDWETAQASNYTIQGSTDAATWTTLATVLNAKQTDHTQITTALSGTFRYVRMNGTTRTTGWGYSIWEVYIYIGGTPLSSTPAVSSSSVAVSSTPVSSAASSVGITKAAITATAALTGTPSLSCDGNTGTRWESSAADPQWIYWDLGSAKVLNSIMIDWEVASASNYTIQGSADAATWTTLATVLNAKQTDHNQITTALSGTFRYVRMYGTTRTTIWGYSIWEVSIYTGIGGSSSSAVSSMISSSAASIPAGGTQIEAESYTAMFGVQTEACSEGGQDVGWIDANDWMSYNVSMAKTGTYRLDYRIGANTASSLDFQCDGTTVNSLNVAATGGFQTWATVGGNVYLPSGTHTMTVYAKTAGFNLNWYKLTLLAEKPAQTTEQVTLTLAVPYVEYLEINFTPASLNGISQVKCQNVSTNVNLTFYKNSEFTVSKGAMTSYLNTAMFSWTDPAGNVEIGNPMHIVATGNFTLATVITNTNGGGSAPVYVPTPTPTPAATPVPDFYTSGPANNSMVYTSRRPTLSWPAVSGATSYQIWMNTSRMDYDFTASGNLLDRYTQIGTATTTSFTLTSDLPDRWTYKWYIIAVTGSGNKKSDVKQFSCYIPVVQTAVTDNVRILNVGGLNFRDLDNDGALDVYEDWRQPIDARVADLMNRMSKLQKAYQMFYGAMPNANATPPFYPEAGFHFGPCDPNTLWNLQIRASSTQWKIPVIIAGDTMVGYKTVYPCQSSLAAAKDYLLCCKLGDIFRKESVPVGYRGVLGPLAEVGTKVLYPRIQEGNGENADVAAAQTRALVCGLQGGPELNPTSVMVTVKHWPGEGAGGEGGITYDETTIKYHMKPWVGALEANCAQIMPGYAGAALFDPAHGAGDSPAIIGYLKNILQYKGVVCTDWLPFGAWTNAAIAGSDVMGGAIPFVDGYSINDFVNSVSDARVNEACARILDMKFRMGLFDMPYGSPTAGPGVWQTADSKAIDKQAAREIMTLIKNDGTLPIAKTAGMNVIMNGDRAQDGSSYTTWTSYFGGDEFGNLTIWGALTNYARTNNFNVYFGTSPGAAKVAICVVGEPYYTHGCSWSNDQPYLPASDVAMIQNYKNQGIPVVVVLILPRPNILANFIDIANAVLIAYRPGDFGGEAVVETLFGMNPPHGKLPWHMPRSMDQVGGLTPESQVERWDLPFDVGATDGQRAEIRQLIGQGLSVPPTYGDPLFRYGDGKDGY